MGWLLVACEGLLLLRLCMSGQILFFPSFAGFLASNIVTAPLYLTGYYSAWYWSQIPVNVLLLASCYEAFRVRSEPLKRNPDPRVPDELDLVFKSSVGFGVCLFLIIAHNEIQFNLPPVLFRIRLFSIVEAAAILLWTSVYLLLQSGAHENRTAKIHYYSFLAYNCVTLSALMVPIHRQDDIKWRVVQVVQQSLRIGVIIAWINPFWEVQARGDTPVRSQGEQSGF